MRGEASFRCSSDDSYTLLYCGWTNKEYEREGMHVARKYRVVADKARSEERGEWRLHGGESFLIEQILWLPARHSCQSYLCSPILLGTSSLRAFPAMSVVVWKSCLCEAQVVPDMHPSPAS